MTDWQEEPSIISVAIVANMDSSPGLESKLAPNFEEHIRSMSVELMQEWSRRYVWPGKAIDSGLTMK